MGSIVNMEILLVARLAVNKYRPVKSRAIEVTASLVGKGEPATGVSTPVTSFRVYTATPPESAANTNAD